MKVKVMAMVIASVLAGNALANSPDAERAAFEQRYALIDSGVATLDNVRAAILSSYVKNNGWPTINSLVSDRYVATTVSSWGSNTVGMANGGGNSYTLSLSTPSSDIAQGIASKVGGVAAGSTVQITMPIPAAAAINSSNLSRVAVPSNPDANKMFTNINMNNNALQNVSQIDAVVLNATTAKLGNVTIETALDVIPDATFRRNVNVLGDIKTKKVDTQTLVVAGGVNIGGNTVSTGDVTGKNIISNNDVVAGGQLRSQSAVINGGVVGDSANFRLGEFESLLTKNQTVTNMFIAKGASEFYQDSLFRGSVTINGALSVGGIASALDIREGGVFLKDKYSQLAAANVFSKGNTFTQAIAANGGLTVDGKTAISADGTTLYEAGIALNAKYLGKGDKAVSAGTADVATRALNADKASFASNADKLDDLDSTAFAQRSAANTMSGANSFTQTIEANRGLTVGGKTVISSNGSTLYEGGVALDAKYLGKGDKAVSAGTADVATRALNADKASFASNADRLDDLDSTAFAQRSAANSMSGVNTFSKAIEANGGVIVDGKTVISSNGSTLYEGGVALDAKYLGKGDKAVSAGTADVATRALNADKASFASNADRLDDLDSTAFAQRSAANTMSGENTFTKAIEANRGLTVRGKTVVSTDGSTLYESGVALNAKYLGKSDKAVSAGTADVAIRALNADNANSANNAEKLGGLTAASYAQRTGSNTFTQANTFNGDLYANNGVIVDGKWVISSDGSTLYESGVALSAKYLGKGDKAVSAGTADTATRAISAETANNADKLDNMDSTAFAQRNAANTMTGVNTFTQAIRADGGIMVGGKWIASADGNSLYEGGTALNAKYLGINDKAKSSADADKLGGVAATSYARKDIAQTFAQAVTLNKGATVDNDWLRINGEYGLYFQSFGGGWNMTDSTWIRAYGGKSIFTSGMVQADGGIRIDDKWVASADGNTLYEGGVALSSKYLGLNDKAKTAVNADNAYNLAGISASNYARNDVANTFKGLQTFNGGIRAVGSSVFDAIIVNNNLAVNGDLLFKDANGTTRTMKDTYTKVASLDAWKAACQRNIKSPECALDIASDTGGSKVVWTGSAASVPNIWGEGLYNVTTNVVKYGIGKVAGSINTNGAVSYVYHYSGYNECGSDGGCQPENLTVYGDVTNGAFNLFYLNLRNKRVNLDITSISKI